MLKDICNLPEKADYFFGSGGSDTIIAITPDKNVYKYFPLVVYFNTSKRSILNIKKDFKYEIEVLKVLTDKFIKTNKTPHIVELYRSYYCRKAPEKIFSGCKTFMEQLTGESEDNLVPVKVKKETSKVKQFFRKLFRLKEEYEIVYNEKPLTKEDKLKNKVCSMFGTGFPLYKLEKGMYIADIEYCNTSLGKELEIISTKPFSEIENFLNILYFQIFYTLETIKEMYPNFIHSDLFIRNIMGVKKDFKENTYIRYKFNDIIFDVPDIGIIFKLNDFGLTQVDASVYKKVKMDYKIVDNPYKDIFAVTYDVYNGANLGAKSLTALIKDNKTKNQLDNYFNKFFDVETIKTIIRNGKKSKLNGVWDKTIDPKFIKYIDLKDGKTILKNFETIFPYNNKHKIIANYGF